MLPRPKQEVIVNSGIMLEPGWGALCCHPQREREMAESLSWAGSDFLNSQPGFVSPSDAESIFCSCCGGKSGRALKQTRSLMSVSHSDSIFSRKNQQDIHLSSKFMTPIPGIDGPGIKTARWDGASTADKSCSCPGFCNREDCSRSHPASLKSSLVSRTAGAPVVLLRVHLNYTEWE